VSAFGDYKAYKKYEPAYPGWKYARDLKESKRQEYLRRHPESIDQNDIQRGKVLIRAIDVMDEYSQKRAEDMEVATETAVGYGLDAAIFGGAAAGAVIGNLKPVKNFLMKHFGKDKYTKYIGKGLPLGIGALAGMIAAFPMYAWAAKAEVAASRRGRFEAMRKDLKNPKGFAVLTEAQIKEAEQKAQNIVIDNRKKSPFSFSNGFKTLREMATDSKEYKAHKKQFDLELLEAEKHMNDEMTPEEILKAKKDQQLLTKLVEKIDIASQDYAENAELATQTLVAGTLAFGTLFNLLLSKALKAMKIKSEGKITAIAQIVAAIIPVILSIASAQIQKQASRVGRFKIKQDLLNNPSKLVYVADENIADLKDVNVIQDRKEGLFKFLAHAWENNKEYNNYQKTTAKQEEKFYKAIETLELTPEQMKDAQTLQRNTFKTFNKVDEKSQKYSESIEALGQAITLPISLIFTAVGLIIGTKYLTKGVKSNSKLEMASNFSKYLTAILLSILPSIGINAIITKEQKKASRIADMLAINEMSDYRHFR
jgi:membrane protein